MTILKKIGDKYNIPFVQSVFKLSISRVILLFLPLVVTPILSRLYSPEEYGLWGIFSSVFYIISSFLFLSYDNTIVKTKDESEVPILVGLSIVVSILIIGITSFTFIVGKIIDIAFFSTFPSELLLAVLLVVTAVSKMADALANRWQRYGVMSIASILNGVSQASLRILFGVFPLVAYGLIVGNVLAQILATIFLVFSLRGILKQYSFKDVSMKKIKDAAIKYKKFPLYDAPARFIELSISNIALILLSLFWSKEDVGAFSMISQFLLIPISLIGTAISTVYYKDICDKNQTEEGILMATRRCAKITYIISLLPILFLVLGGDKLLVMFLGEKWVASGKMALCLSIFSVPVILSEPLLPIFRTLDKQELRFKLNILCLVLTQCSLVVSALIFKNIYISLIVFSFFYAFCRFLMYHKALRLTNVKIKMVSKYFVVAIVASYILLVIRLLYVFV